MFAVAEPHAEQKVSYAPNPAAGFFITSKLLDEVPSLREASLNDRVRAMLAAAENDLFHPLLVSSKPTDFQQTFELLANKYFPVRLAALVLILQTVGARRFKLEYFDKAPQFAANLSLHSQAWGLVHNEVSDAFTHYFSSAQRLIRISSRLNAADPAQLLRLVSCITEIDYGFTAMGLVFEGTIPSERWCVSEIFRLTRRTLFEYRDATNSLVNALEAGKAEQQEMFTSVQGAAGIATKVVEISPRAPGQSGRHLRSIASTVQWPAEDQDSDYD